MRPNGHIFVCFFIVALFHFQRAHVKAHVDVSLWILEQLDASERLMVTSVRISHKFCVLHRAAERLPSVADLELIFKLQFIVRPQLHIGIIAAVEGRSVIKDASSLERQPKRFSNVFLFDAENMLTVCTLHYIDSDQGVVFIAFEKDQIVNQNRIFTRLEILGAEFGAFDGTQFQ